MSWVVVDRVKETTTTTGTGDIALAGAVSQFQAFSSVCAIGDTFYYAIVGQSGTEWEVGFGTYSALNTLTRTRVLASSNAGAAVNFSAGTKDVFIDLAASQGTFAPQRGVAISDAVVPEGATVYSSGAFEVAAGKTLEIRPGGTLEVG